jgi:predicted small lipoprotein YifL
MMGRLAAAAILVLMLASCGVKNDLDLPDGKQTAKGQHDPSKPPQPIGE